MFPVQCWLTWSQAPWILSGLDLLARSSDQTTLSLVKMKKKYLKVLNFKFKKTPVRLKLSVLFSRSEWCWKQLG